LTKLHNKELPSVEAAI